MASREYYLKQAQTFANGSRELRRTKSSRGSFENGRCVSRKGPWGRTQYPEQFRM